MTPLAKSIQQSQSLAMMGITEEVAPLHVERMEIGAIHLFHHVTHVSSLQLSLINSLIHLSSLQYNVLWYKTSLMVMLKSPNQYLSISLMKNPTRSILPSQSPAMTITMEEAVLCVNSTETGIQVCHCVLRVSQ